MKRYLDMITGKLKSAGLAGGCLIGDLARKASGSSKVLRAAH